MIHVTVSALSYSRGAQVHYRPHLLSACSCGTLGYSGTSEIASDAFTYESELQAVSKIHVSSLC